MEGRRDTGGRMKKERPGFLDGAYAYFAGIDKKKNGKPNCQGNWRKKDRVADKVFTGFLF